MRPRHREPALLQAVLCMLACTLISSPGQLASADGAAEPLIAGVETTPFLAAIGVPKPVEFALGRSGVSYRLPKRQAEGATDISLGVYPSAETAAQKYQELVAEAARAQQPDLPGDIGDQFGFRPDGDAAGTVLLRRQNVLFAAGWQGSREAAIEFARKVDNVLAQSDEICPRGAVVATPEVELIAPKLAALGSAVPIRYTSRKAMFIRSETDPRLHIEGNLHFDARELGKHAVEFVFASSKNVIFKESLTIQVVPPEELPGPQTVEPWEWPGHELYFVRDPEQEWSAIPSDQQERLTLHRSTFAPLKDARDWQQKGLNELVEVVRGRWLPTMEVMQAYQNDARPSQDKVYYAAFHTKGCGVVYMGSVTKGFLLYVEQPDPLPEGRKQLTVEDVLGDDLLQTQTSEGRETSYPRVGFVVRTFHRYRGYQPEGPYEPVQILLAAVRFPAELNLRFPGYR